MDELKLRDNVVALKRNHTNGVFTDCREIIASLADARCLERAYDLCPPAVQRFIASYAIRKLDDKPVKPYKVTVGDSVSLISAFDGGERIMGVVSGIENPDSFWAKTQHGSQLYHTDEAKPRKVS